MNNSIDNLVGRIYKEAKEYGYNNGYGIGIDNVFGYGIDQEEEFKSDCLDTECDNFRQYSPFEIFASKLNAQSDFVSARAWEIYERNVSKGIEDAWADYLDMFEFGEK